MDNLSTFSVGNYGLVFFWSPLANFQPIQEISTCYLPVSGVQVNDFQIHEFIKHLVLQCLPTEFLACSLRNGTNSDWG